MRRGGTCVKVDDVVEDERERERERENVEKM